jgi:hypothetical protein
MKTLNRKNPSRLVPQGRTFALELGEIGADCGRCNAAPGARKSVSLLANS